MIRIGLLSDTHGHIDQAILDALVDCDEVWHAGDVGDIKVLHQLQSLGKSVKAVFGNIDGHIVRLETREMLVWSVEKMKILMTHIGGYPGHYNARMRELITTHQPDITVCGHSHILKVIYDKQLHHLHLNPGACGKEGFHETRTLLRFTIDGDKVKDMEVVEWERRG
jgi:putative phosphoesterase